MPDPDAPRPDERPEDRPDNREVENEDMRPVPSEEGPPRPATEPPGAKPSTQSPELETDPGTGAQKS